MHSLNRIAPQWPSETVRYYRDVAYQGAMFLKAHEKEAAVEALKEMGVRCRFYALRLPGTQGPKGIICSASRNYILMLPVEMTPEERDRIKHFTIKH